MVQRKPTEAKTTLDNDVTKPSVTAPGDGPADTTDPTEIAVSVPPQPGDEAIAVGTVNAVKPVAPPEKPKLEREHRIEKYEATRPDGSKVTVTHNIDTGETTAS
ncbi:hypothetical protein [Amycolatopsis kentuckyensis]|uniref:hypothetical protein n=1 Tax=Amycolatopsis kentuckyensis TaxID=218823 RepID=UPI003568FB9B